MFCLELFISVFLNWVISDCFNSNIIKKSMIDIRESDKIYHGCINENKDGTNKLIKKEKNVLRQHTFLFGNVFGMFQMAL